MQTLTLALKSRTVWTVVAMFLIGGVQAIQSSIPVGDVMYVQGFLGILAVYFKLNPSQSYNG